MLLALLGAKLSGEAVGRMVGAPALGYPSV